MNGHWIGRALAAALIALLAACEDQQVVEKEVIRPVKAIKVGDQKAIQGRWFSGRAKAAREVNLSFRVAGQLLEFPVDVGDDIKTDEVLARLDPATFKAVVSGDEASLKRAEATLKNATYRRERNETLWKKGHVAKAKVDQVIALEEEAKADVAAAKAALEKSKLDLGYTVLKAPFAGAIVAKYVENFEDINAKEPIVRLLDSSKIEMVVDIPENLISLAPTVKEVKVVFDAFADRELPATIKEIGSEANETTRTYPVTLIMDQPRDVKILPGMAGKAGKATGSADAEAQLAEHVIPVSATFSPGEGGSTFVWVVDRDGKTVSKREIETGPLTDQGITVVDGIERGEWVVTAGVSQLRDGQQVRLLQD